MKKIIILINLALVASLITTAQTWYFGNKAGIKFTNNSGWNVSAAAGSALLSQVNTGEGCSVTGDANGNVLLYTNGVNVWDASGNKVQTSLGADVALNGSSSSTQSGLIIPIPCPGSVCFQKYYVFGVPDIGTYSSNTGQKCNPNFGVTYTIVTKTGAVWVASPVQRISQDADGNSIASVTEKITAIGDVNNGYWLLFHGFYNDNAAHTGTTCPVPPTQNSSIGKKFFSIKISPANCGTLPTPIVSTVDPLISRDREHTSFKGNGSQGQLKFSKDGTKVAMVTFSAHQIFVYNFNTSTGIVSPSSFVLDNFIGANSSNQNDNLPREFGVEFSPGGRYLYVSYENASNSNKVSRFDLSLGTPIEETVKTSISKRYGELQIGPDNNIYLAYHDQPMIGQISNTEAAIGSVGFNEIPITQTAGPGRSLFGLPTLVQNEMICGENTTVNTTFPPFDPCCPPLNKDVLRDMMFYSGSGSISDNYTLRFQPTPAFEAQMQAYFNYLKLACNPAIDKLVINWRLTDQGTGSNPLPGNGPSSADQAFTWWDGTPPTVFSPVGFFNSPNPYPMQINRWYMVHTGIYLEPAGRFCFSANCSVNDIYVRIQVQERSANGRGVLQYSDGKKIIKTVPIK